MPTEIKQANMLKEIISNRKLIWDLSKNDFKTRFAGSYLGIIWAFVQPIVTVLVYWFVFEKGMHASGINLRSGITAPFVLWLIAGLVPWFFFQEVLSGGTNALMEYSYLVKKVVFQIDILPIIKLISALFVHLFFIAFTCSTEIAMLSMQLPFYNTSAKCGFNFLNIFVPIMNNTIVRIQ
jgi:teichoic acid transport system permease protein